MHRLKMEECKYKKVSSGNFIMQRPKNISNIQSFPAACRPFDLTFECFHPFKCIWQTFFICSVKSTQSTDKYRKKFFSITIFLVLMYQKRQISLLVGYKTARPKIGDWEWMRRQFRTSSLAKNRFLRNFLISYKNALLYHFLVNWLAHNKKISFFQVCSTIPYLHSFPGPIPCVKAIDLGVILDATESVGKSNYSLDSILQRIASCH